MEVVHQGKMGQNSSFVLSSQILTEGCCNTMVNLLLSQCYRHMSVGVNIGVLGFMK